MHALLGNFAVAAAAQSDAVEGTCQSAAAAAALPAIHHRSDF
jgi:hypothetical protein